LRLVGSSDLHLCGKGNHLKSEPGEERDVGTRELCAGDTELIVHFGSHRASSDYKLFICQSLRSLRNVGKESVTHDYAKLRIYIFSKTQ